MPFRFTHYLQVKTTLLFFSKILTKFLDNLIKRFVESQRDIPKDTDSYGEVNLQLELKRAPTMDKQLSVRVVSAERLLWRTSGTFKPYIELNIVGPQLKSLKRTHATKTVRNQWSPKFNETARFL